MGSGKSKDLRARGRGFYRPAKKRNGRAQVGMCALPHETTSETDGPAKTIAIIRGSPERASKLSLTKSPTSQAGRGIWRSRSYPFHPGTRIGCVSAGLHPVTTSWSRASDGSLWDSRRLRKMPSSNTSPSNRKVGGTQHFVFARSAWATEVSSVLKKDFAFASPLRSQSCISSSLVRVTCSPVA